MHAYNIFEKKEVNFSTLLSNFPSEKTLLMMSMWFVFIM